MAKDLSKSVFYVLNADQHILGAGFVVDSNLAVTSSSLIAEAGSTPNVNLSIRFLSEKVALSVQVIEPGLSNPNQDGLAFLKLEAGAYEPFSLGYSDESGGHPCFCMLNAQSSLFSWQRGIISGVENNPDNTEPLLSVYIDSELPCLVGSPVVDGFTGLAVGMLSTETHDASAVIAETLQVHWPALKFVHTTKDGTAPVSQAPSPTFQPHPSSLLPELRHLIGHQAELSQLNTLLSNTVQKKRVELFFLSGSFGCGAKALGRAFADASRKNAAAIITRFWPVEIAVEAINQDARWSIEVKIWQPFLQSAQFLSQPEYVSLLPILAQALSHKLITPEDLTSLKRIDQIRPILERIFDTTRPAVLLLEDFEFAAQPWETWLKDLKNMKPRSTGGLILVTLHSNRALQDLKQGERTSAQSLALELSARSQAVVLNLSTVQAADIAAHLGRVQPELAVRLHALSGGIPLLVDNLWESLYARGHVNQRFDGSWELDGRSAWQTRRTPQDYIKEILDELYAQPDPPSWDKNTMHLLLACAAQEGPMFTGEALAAAFHLDLEEMLAAFDYILDAEFEDGYDQTGLIVDLPPVTLTLPTVGWSGQLHRFRFQPLIVWRSLFENDSPPPEVLGRFADCLAQAYWPFVNRIAGKLSQLYMRAERPQEAAVFQKLTQSGDHFTALQNEISLLEKAKPQPDDQIRVRARLLDLNRQVLNEGLAEGLSPDVIRQAGAKVLALAQALGRNDEKILAEFQLAELDKLSGHASAAARTFEKLIPLFEASGQEEYLIICLLRLGDINLIQKRWQKAEELFEHALDLASDHENTVAIAMALKGLGAIDIQQGRVEEAIDAYSQAIELFQSASIQNLAQACQAELNKIRSSKRL